MISLLEGTTYDFTTGGHCKWFYYWRALQMISLLEGTAYDFTTGGHCK